MVNWFLLHGATVMIFAGGGLATVAAFISDRRASSERERRRKGGWPWLILAGTIISGVGALWAGYGQDRLFDYLSGGDSYGLFIPLPPTNKSMPIMFMHQGTLPLYDVYADVIDVSKRNMELSKSALPSPDSLARHQMSTDDWSRYWILRQETTTTISVGNVTPGSVRVVWNAPLPISDDQQYDFAVWERNGLFTEQLLLHRLPSGWVWAWRLDRTFPQLKNSKAKLVDERVLPGFPQDKIIWK